MGKSFNKMHAESILQRLINFCGGTSVAYPIKCSMCGQKTKGNILIGYRMGCHCEKKQ